MPRPGLTMPKAVTYEDAGVSIREADKLVEFLSSRNKAIGGFSGLFPVPQSGKSGQMLVASTDGVGTKILVANMTGELSSIGIDLVAMVVNDLITCGARPLFFLDYYAMGQLKFADARKVLSGIENGCEQAGCVLLGGETAEMPGLYQPGEFDLAGFGVGIVDRDKVINGKGIRTGDVVIGFESSGLHSNGYSLAREVLLKKCGLNLKTRIKELSCTLAAELLRPTRIYAKLARDLQKAGIPLKAMAHITGGGIPGNLNRVLPKKLDAVVFKNRWDTPPIFKLIQRCGPVDYDEMLHTFNLGIGYMAVVSPSAQSSVLKIAKKAGYTAHAIGHIVKGSGKVRVEVE
jgi:phosphoribosylformylglycinamidine cyclo-ligase